SPVPPPAATPVPADPNPDPNPAPPPDPETEAEAAAPAASPPPDPDPEPEPDPVIEADTVAVTVVRGGEVPVRIDCAGTVSVGIAGGERTGGELDTVDLAVGDHVVEVRCDDTTVAEVAVTVVEPLTDRAGPGGAAAALILLVAFTAIVVTASPGAATLRDRSGGSS
ncbi:MAG TPA: hypothetical protein VK866_19830, partial [Acidimicrobiales bacterium]|nr:hypothetical protein [Acidimicrobiales bacterium]